MTEILFEYGKSISLRAISKEEDLNQPGGILINPPPRDGRCEVCGRHISELSPFGGSGDPLIGDFSGELLVKRWRTEAPYDEAADRAWKEFRKEGPEQDDPFPWFFSKYGRETAIKFYWWEQLYGSLRPSWECRDCIVLDEDEYFEAIDKRSKENLNK